VTAMDARGTRRPGGAGRARGSAGGADIGDSIGPGDGTLAGCVNFARGLFWLVVIAAVCVGIALLL
jgi:hypothetical protein